MHLATHRATEESFGLPPWSDPYILQLFILHQAMADDHETPTAESAKAAATRQAFDEDAVERFAWRQPLPERRHAQCA